MILIPYPNSRKQRQHIFRRAKEVGGFVKHRYSGKYYKIVRIWGEDAVCKSVLTNKVVRMYYENTDGFVYVSTMPEFKEIDWI